MSKKQEKKKTLRKSLCVIVDIYMDQKGEKKRKQLSGFIEKKIAEIMSFRDNFSNKKKKTQKKEKSEDDIEIKPQVSMLRPSPALAEELHNSTNNDQEFTNVATT